MGNALSELSPPNVVYQYYHFNLKLLTRKKGYFEDAVVYSLHNVWVRVESSLNPELNFNLIEACHQISGLCFQWLPGTVGAAM